MPLLDLTPELLMLIAKHVGAAELRTSVSYLLVSRRWYQAALPTYLSAIPLSDIYLSSRDLERLPPPNTPLRDLIEAKARRLSLRLVGHPSRQTSTKPWHINEEEDEEDGNDEIEDQEAQSDDWMVAGSTRLENRGHRERYGWDKEMEQQLRPWRAGTNYLLTELARTLPALNQLEELSFQASSRDEATQGPRWDYIFDSPIRGIISHLPPTLRNFTLDTCGSNIISSHGRKDPLHLCPIIAQCLHNLENVRLRMRSICPQIFNVPPARASKLKTLVIRLSLPFFPEASYETHDGYTEFDAHPCERGEKPLYTDMIEAGTAFTKTAPSLTMMRVSYRPTEGSGVNLDVADCLNRRYLYVPSEIFSYEDDGKEWAAWEDNDESLWVSRAFY